MDIFYQEKAFHAGKKSGKLCPLRKTYAPAHVMQQNVPVLLQVSPLEYFPSVLPSTARSATPSLAVAIWLVDVPYKTILSENRIPDK